MMETSLNPATPGRVMPISVMIMTYNRVDSLQICLQHLEEQTCRDFEVLVVVDGSTDGTLEELERYRHTAPYPLRYVTQKNQGLAKARNAGLNHLRSPLCLSIGDDIFARPEFVQVHLDFHRAHPEQYAAAVGYTRWDDKRQTVTPLMRWLDGDGGMQFSYKHLLAGETANWRSFYSSNLSLKTDYLRMHPSHEGFDQYGLEDIELGYRLERQAGLKLYFLADAVAEHLHPTDYPSYCCRMVNVGASAYEIGKLWPEFRRRPPKNRLKRILLQILTEPKIVLPLLVRLTDVLNRLWLPNPLTRRVLELHERFGYRRAAAKAERSA